MFILSLKSGCWYYSASGPFYDSGANNIRRQSQRGFGTEKMASSEEKVMGSCDLVVLRKYSNFECR